MVVDDRRGVLRDVSGSRSVVVFPHDNGRESASQDWEQPNTTSAPASESSWRAPGAARHYLEPEDDLFSFVRQCCHGQVNAARLGSRKTAARSGPRSRLFTSRCKSATENTVGRLRTMSIVIVNDSPAYERSVRASSDDRTPAWSATEVRPRRRPTMSPAVKTVWRNDDLLWKQRTARDGTQSGGHLGLRRGPQRRPTEDLFYLTATHSWETGEEVFRTYIGDGTTVRPDHRPGAHPPGWHPLHRLP